MFYVTVLQYWLLICPSTFHWHCHWATHDFMSQKIQLFRGAIFVGLPCSCHVYYYITPANASIAGFLKKMQIQPY